MNKSLKIFILIIFFSIQFSCTKKEKVTVLKNTDLQTQMIELYKEGYEEFLKGDTLFAAQKFNEAETLYPQSSWAPKSALMAAYSYYVQDYYGDAIVELQRFVRIYKNYKDLDYAYYLLSVCYF